MFLKIQLLLAVLVLATLQSAEAGLKNDVLFRINFNTTGVVEVTYFSSAGSPEDTAGQQSPEDMLFYNYWTVKDFEAYKALFYANEYPKIDESRFYQWRRAVNAASATIKGKVKFRIGGKEYCIIQSGKNKGAVRQAFMMKFVNNQWCPVSSEENVKFKELKEFFTLVRADALAALMDIEPYKKEAYIPSATFSHLKSTYRLNNVIQGTQLLNDVKEAGKTFSQKLTESVLVLTWYYTPESSAANMRKATSAQDQQMASYLDSLGLPQSDVERVLAMIHAEKYTNSAVLVQELLKEDSAKPHAMKIREIYGEDKIRIYNSVEGKWR